MRTYVVRQPGREGVNYAANFLLPYETYDHNNDRFNSLSENQSFMNMMALQSLGDLGKNQVDNALS